MTTAGSYDIILVGDGCASFMLLEALSRHQDFTKLSVLLLGSGEQLHRSWCFWESDLPSPFREMVETKWQEMTFVSGDFQKRERLKDRYYHYLPGENFFRYFKDWFLPAHPQIHYVNDRVVGITGKAGAFIVETQGSAYRSASVYNSAWLPELPTIEVWQHFRGWFIELEEEILDPRNVVLMDFNTPQHQGCSFMYLLPFSKNTALVEWTLFSPEILEISEYEAQINAYIKRQFGVGFRILRREFGKIPMQQGCFHPTGQHGEIQIGTLGGMVKPSTGYAFQRMREDSELMARAYFDNSFPARRVSHARYNLYDDLLLWIIRHEPMACKPIFTSLFKKQEISTIARFLDEKTKPTEELSIISQLPAGIFLKALWHRHFSLKRLFKPKAKPTPALHA